MSLAVKSGELQRKASFNAKCNTSLLMNRLEEGGLWSRRPDGPPPDCASAPRRKPAPAATTTATAITTTTTTSVCQQVLATGSLPFLRIQHLVGSLARAESCLRAAGRVRYLSRSLEDNYCQGKFESSQSNSQRWQQEQLDDNNRLLAGQLARTSAGHNWQQTMRAVKPIKCHGGVLDQESVADWPGRGKAFDRLLSP